VLARNGLLLAGIALLLVGLGFKVAAVPFHAWTPDVYQGSPSPMVAYMASGVKAAGFAGLLRVLLLAFPTQGDIWRDIVAILACATIVGGTVAAVVQTDVKRMMAYSSISHAGFILVGVQAATARGTSAALFYLAAYTFMVGGTFGVITLVGRRGDDHHDLSDYRGLARSRPVLAVVFALFLMAQAGVPPTSGFFAKFGVMSAAVEGGAYWLAIVAMVASVIGAFVYLRLIVTMFGAAEGDDAHAGAAGGEAEADDAEAVSATTAAASPERAGSAAIAALALAAAVTVVVGLVPSLVSDPSGEAVPVLVHPTPGRQLASP